MKLEELRDALNIITEQKNGQLKTVVLNRRWIYERMQEILKMRAGWTWGDLRIEGDFLANELNANDSVEIPAKVLDDFAEEVRFLSKKRKRTKLTKEQAVSTIHNLAKDFQEKYGPKMLETDDYLNGSPPWRPGSGIRRW